MNYPPRAIRVVPPAMPVTDAPMPIANEVCPDCDKPIVEGSAWRVDTHLSARVHTSCLTSRKVKVEQAQPPATNLDIAADQVNRAMAASDPSLAVSHLAAAIERVIFHLRTSQ